MTAVPRPSAKAFVAMVLATAFITTTAAGCGRTGSGRAPAAQESIAGCDLPSALAGSPVIFQLQIVQALYESMTPDQRRTAGMDAITADGKIAETLDFARWYNDHEAPLTLQGRELRDWETDLLRYFKTPSAAYAAYCGGWRFKDYLATHPGPLPGSSTPISP